MSNEEVPDFTADDCQRWIKKLQDMAVKLEKRGDGDGAKMFAIAAVLVEDMAVQIQRQALAESYPNPFGGSIGEA